jgi:hypothetical protein
MFIFFSYLFGFRLFHCGSWTFISDCLIFSRISKQLGKATISFVISVPPPNLPHETTSIGPIYLRLILGIVRSSACSNFGQTARKRRDAVHEEVLAFVIALVTNVTVVTFVTKFANVCGYFATCVARLPVLLYLLWLLPSLPRLTVLLCLMWLLYHLCYQG